MRIIIFISILIGVIACSPSAKFLYHQTDNLAPSAVTFKNLSKNSDHYTWMFGDGTTSKDENPMHRYDLSGRYRVELKAHKGNKTSIDKKDVFVYAPQECLVILQTEYGDIILELFEDTPLHRDNFIALAEKGFYDDLLFHRVIERFMIQGGDPNSKNAKEGVSLGSGGPGYQIPAEISAKHVHLKGALAAARKGDGVNPDKDSSGSQFYIVHGSPVSDAILDQQEIKTGIRYSEEQRKRYLAEGGTPFLDHNYTVFGRVIQGFEVVEEIAKAAKDKSDRPLEDIEMNIIIVK